MTVKINKTNAARLLDREKIAYRLIPYRFDENDLAAIHVARELNEPVERVFKTLVLRGERRGILVCVIPGDGELDLKKAARAAGDKSVAMLRMKELLPTTGYVRGGCSPLGMKKRFPVFIHSSCMDFDTIYVSAGVRGLQIEIAPRDLVRMTEATVEDLI